MNITKGKLPNPKNYKSGRSQYIKYIVIHYTANKGDTAANNVKYFANNEVSASAHYFVDEKHIYSSVPVGDAAWHCGGGRQSNSGGSFYKKCTNQNSIGIEMCLLDKSGLVKTATIQNAAELTKYLMETYNIPPENVIRHWDVTGKNCPAFMTGDNNELWEYFKGLLKEGADTMKLEMLEKELEKLKNPMIYNYIDKNMPEFARPTIQKLCDKGYLKGDKSGLGLSYDMLRMLVILDRAGVFE